MGSAGDRDLTWLRRQFIVALASDDELFELLVLKGGNALNLLYEVGERSSLDLDYSLEKDVDDAEELSAKLRRSLTSHLDGLRFRVFDWGFVQRPRKPGEDFDPTWGGYNALFKIIEHSRLEELGGDLQKARNHAWNITSDGGASRKFRIELSKFEYCAGAQERVVEGFSVRVYTLAMIAAEKLRSLCQQMREYRQRAEPSSRASDLYDIYTVATEGGVNLASSTNREMLLAVFAAKSVPLELLARLEEYREFHRLSWDAVTATIPSGRDQDFDAYFDYVLRLTRDLESIWKEDAP